MRIWLSLYRNTAENGPRTSPCEDRKDVIGVVKGQLKQRIKQGI